MMNCKMKEKIKIEIEIGHWAKRISTTPAQPVLPNSSVQNATHVWKVWVCGRRGQLESFVERVVFQLHPTFPNPNRVVSRPPFEIEEKAFGTFPMKIELHFNDSMAGFEYEVFLMLDKDINCKSIKSFAIANPRPPEFREKLIRAGGIVVDPSEDSPLGPSEVKLTKASKPASVPAGGLVRHRSKSKSAAAALLESDDQLFASPASSTDELQPTSHSGAFTSSLPQSPQQQSQSAAAAAASSSRSVGNRLASPSKAKLRESGAYTARPKPAQAAAVKPEPAVSVVSELDLQQEQPEQPEQQQPVPSVPRIAEIRSDEVKSEKLVLKISKSPIKSSPAVVPPVSVTMKTEPTDSAMPIADSCNGNPPQQQGWSTPLSTAETPTATTAAPAMVAVVAPHVAIDAIKSSPPSVAPPQPQPPPPPLPPPPSATYSESPSVPASWQPGGNGTTESDEDRRKRKKEKRKKEKHHRHHHHHHRPRSRHAEDGSAADSDSDADRKRHERRRHRHDKEKKRRRRDEHDGNSTAAVSVASTVSASAAVQQLPFMDSGGIVAEASQAPPAAAEPPPPPPQQQPPQPPPMLEAEPPMLSPYLQSAAPKEDPELMSQTSVESTGFRPAAAGDRASSSADSSPLAAASIPISAAAMAAESSALARHPKYQWSAQSALSREEYDQRFQLCLLAASLDDPDRLQLLASVLADSEALTNRDTEYANFDLAKLRPDCVKRLVALLMPDSAS